MAGRPQRRAMVKRLRERGGWRWLMEEIASGRTAESVFKELETSRWQFYGWLNKTERSRRAYQLARMIGASARIEKAMELADGPKTADGGYDAEADTKVRVARDKLRVEWNKWLAGVDDPDTYGKKEEKVTHQTINVLHLDALRARVVEEKVLLDANLIPAGLRKKEHIVQADIVEAEIEGEDPGPWAKPLPPPVVGGSVVIAGGPKCGKTTAAQRLAPVLGFVVRSTDELISGHDWSSVSAEVATWLPATGAIVEGVATARALRKWLVGHPDGRPCDVVLLLEQPYQPLNDGQERMRKGCNTVWHEIASELIGRGVKIVTDPAHVARSLSTVQWGESDA